MSSPRIRYHDQLRHAGSDLSDAAVRLAFVLDGYAGAKDRTCWPSQKRLAKDLEWSESKLKRTMTELQRKGYVTYLKRAHQRGQKSLIWVDKNTHQDKVSEPTPGVIPDPDPVSSMNGPGVTDDTQNLPKNLPKNPPSREGTPDGVDDLYQQAVGRLPAKLLRRIDSEPHSHRERLYKALAEAQKAGVRGQQIRDLWDRPSPLDDGTVKSVSATLASRIEKTF